MLYQMYDLGRSFAAPMADLAQTYARWLNDLDVTTPLSRRTAATCELAHRLGKTYDRPPFNITRVQSGAGAARITEEVVAERPFCTLLHFSKRWEGGRVAPRQPAVLLVAPLAGHHATLLRDTVRELLKDHDVYITDWRDARQVPLAVGSFGLDDYVGYLRDFMRQLGPELHVVAVCQATVPLLGAVSLMASARDPHVPRSMTMLSGPIDTRHAPTRVNRLATEHTLAWFRDCMIHTVPPGHPGAGRRVYPGFIQHACFVMMNAERHAQSYRDFYERRCRGEDVGRHCDFYDDYNATLDMPEQFYLDTIDTVFKECRLARGSWQVGGQEVRPQDIRDVALLTVEGDRDDITSPGQTAAALALCAGIAPAHKHSYVAPGCGHYATFSGSHWRDTICPKIRDFIGSQSFLLQAA